METGGDMRLYHHRDNTLNYEKSIIIDTHNGLYTYIEAVLEHPGIEKITETKIDWITLDALEQILLKMMEYYLSHHPSPLEFIRVGYNQHQESLNRNARQYIVYYPHGSTWYNDNYIDNVELAKKLLDDLISGNSISILTRGWRISQKQSDGTWKDIC